MNPTSIANVVQPRQAVRIGGEPSEPDWVRTRFWQCLWLPAIVLLLTGAATRLSAAEDADSSGKDGVPIAVPKVVWNWTQVEGFEPQTDIEASGLAVDDRGRLYLLSEGHGVLLRFSEDAADKPTVIRLQLPSSLQNSTKGGFDLEAVSIVRNRAFVCDEHSLRVYVCHLSDGRLLHTLKLEGTVDQRPTGRRHDNGRHADASQKSLEGMVVRPSATPRGFDIYLLDEHDESSAAGRTTYASVLYRGTFELPSADALPAGSSKETRVAIRPLARFALGHNEYERLTELMYFDKHFYTIRSVRYPPGYALARLEFPEPPACGAVEGRLVDVLRWEVTDRQYSSNFEGGVITADGRLLLCTDGPGFQAGSWRRPQPVRYRTFLADYGRIPQP